MKCKECVGKIVITNIGRCKNCGGGTSSGMYKLCRSCSDKLNECEHCLKTLTAEDKSK